MLKVKITALRQAQYDDLISVYENPLENPCEMTLGDVFYSFGECPNGFCKTAWESVGPFAKALCNGEENFFDGWMKNPKSAMVSCNDGFRPLTFYLEVCE